MKPKFPELVLNFNSVSGHARNVLQHSIQTALFALGYFWASNPASKVPRHLDALALYINSTQNASPLCMNSTHSAPLIMTGEALVFDVSTQAFEFLEYARKARVIEQVIDGVSVTITPDNVTLDATAKLLEIMQKAKAIQAQHFGQG